MGRFTKRYSPAPFDFAVRVRPVCSPTMVTSTLGITLPELSVISPVMPPSVCCAKEGEIHNAATATNVRSRNIEEEIRMENINGTASQNRDFPWSCLGAPRPSVDTPIHRQRQTKKRKDEQVRVLLVSNSSRSFYVVINTIPHRGRKSTGNLRIFVANRALGMPLRNAR